MRETEGALLVSRGEDGTWSVKATGHEQEGHKAVYNDALGRYLNIFDPAFFKAKEKCEFEFIFTILRVRGVQDAGWDPYETSVRSIPLIQKVATLTNDYETARHLELWMYGHIVEAAEPFEILMNLINVIKGGRFVTDCFPIRLNRCKSFTPGQKMRKLKEESEAIGLNIAQPFAEIWNRELRNSIFHADYSLYGSSIRTIRPSFDYSDDRFMTLLNKALAYHNAVACLNRIYVESYKEPKVIDMHLNFARKPNEKAVAIVRKNHGVVGLKDDLTDAEIERGAIPVRLGRFYRDEIEAMDADHNLSFLPERPAART